MFFELLENSDNKQQRHKIALKNLQEQQEVLNQQVDELYAQIGVDLEELIEKMQSKENFTAQCWNSIEKKRKELNSEQERLLFTILDTRECKKKQQQRQLPPYSLFCR